MYTTENKPAKRFDYNAYIQGRRASKYVIAYIDNDIPEEPLTEHINNSIEPYKNNNFDTEVSEKEKYESGPETIDTGIDGLSAYPELITNSIPVKCEVIILYNIPFKQVPDINCRGAPII